MKIDLKQLSKAKNKKKIICEDCKGIGVIWPMGVDTKCENCQNKGFYFK